MSGVGRSYAGVPALVLGASGFIGRWVARRLAHAGARVTCAARDPASARALLARWGVTAELIQVDVMEQGSVAALVTDAQPAIVFNLVGYGVDRTERDEATFWRINDQLVDDIARAVDAVDAPPGWKGLRLVHTGSALEYGEIGGHLAEDQEPNPTTLYGQSKLAGTRRLAAHPGLPSVTARLFTVYGPGEHDGRLLPSLLSATGHSGTIPLTAGTQRRDFTYVEDVAEGLLRLGVGKPVPGGAVNLATGKLMSVRDFAERAARILRIPERRLNFGALPQRSDEMPHEAVATDLLRRSLDWVPDTTVEAGVERTQQFLATIQTPGVPA